MTVSISIPGLLDTMFATSFDKLLVGSILLVSVYMPSFLCTAPHGKDMMLAQGLIKDEL